MEAGAMQSVLQITVALNIAYFSFREIRTPVFSRHDKKIKYLLRQISEIRELIKVIKEPDNWWVSEELNKISSKRRYTDAVLNMHEYNTQMFEDPYHSNIDNFDKGIRWFSIIFAFAGFIMLFFSSAYADFEITVQCFLLITIFCIAPTFASIFYNMAITTQLQDDDKEIEKILKEIRDIKSDFTKNHIPQYHKLMSTKEHVGTV